MKRILLFLLSLAAASVLSLQAGNYKNFKSVAYVTSQEVNRYGTVEGWEAAWKDFSRNLKLDKVYLSTFNNSVPAEDAAIKAAIKFFKSKGVEVSGGITYNNGGGKLQDLMSGEVLDGTPGQDARVYARARGDVATVKVTLPPHSFRAFKVRN